MPRRLHVFYSLLTAGLLLIPIVALYSELSKRPDVWWTPPGMALSLAESKDRVEIFAGGHALGTLLGQGQLLLRDGAGTRALRAEDIRLRFNNWDQVRAARGPRLVVYAAAIGGGLVLLVLMVAGRLIAQAEREAVAA